MKPKYLELVEHLETMMEQMGKNQMIPSERELSSRHSISRMTVRKAVDFLVKQNKLYRINKVGTFTTDERLYKQADSFSGFTNEVENAGGIPGNQLIEYSLQGASAFIAAKLNIKEGELIYRIVRLRRKNNVPIMIDEVYFPKALIPLTEEIVQGSIYEYIENDLKLDVNYATQSYHATFPNKTFAKYLEIDENTPIIETELSAFLSNGQVFEYNKAYINTNRYEIFSRSYR